jgi:nucleoside-diphosphate-sugar epimerase
VTDAVRNPSRSVLVTGATGFIGRRLQDRLLDEGWRVRVLARSSSPRARHVNPRAEMVDGSFADENAVNRAVAGTVAVINCAGSVRGNSYQDFEPANVGGVKALSEAVSRLGVPPAILHLSSLAATEPHLSHYAQSKRDGEAMLENYPDLAWTVIRPPAVYGPGDTEMRPALAWTRRGIVPVAGGDLNQRLSLLHVDDLVSAVLAWLKNPSAHRHRTYAIDDGTTGGYDWHAIAAAVYLKERPIFLKLPAPLLNTLGSINEALARLTRRPVMLSRGKVRELTHLRWVADNAEFALASGWQPRITLADGVNGLFES